LTIWGTLQAASVRARIRGRYFMEVCLVLGGGKVKVLGDDRLANLRLTAKQRDGTYRQLASPANTETRMMIQRAIVAEYEKLVSKEDPVPSARLVPERLRALEQLKTDGLINEEEYNVKRKEILGEL
jgi:DNA-binding cell septation regulator SpoVG